MSISEFRTWAAAVVVAGSFAAGSAYLVKEQWRSELADADRAGRTSVAQLIPFLTDALNASRTADVPKITTTWGQSDPTVSVIRVQTHDGALLADFSRAMRAAPTQTFSAPLPFRDGEPGRVTLISDLSGVIARRNRLTFELGFANTLLAAAVVTVALLLNAHRRSVRRYRTASAINHSLLNEADTRTFLNAICTAAVIEGGYALAWIGLTDDEPVLRPQALAGPALGYAEGLRLSPDASLPEGRGPAGIAMRTGRPVYTNDFLRDPQTADWVERAARYGIRASAALPLARDGQPIGVLGLYSRQRGHFDAAERMLVEQMAGDISLGLEHRRRGVALQRSSEQQREILDGLLTFVALTSDQGVIEEVNRAPAVAIGVPREALIGVALPDTIGFSRSVEAQKRIRDALAKARGGSVARYDETIWLDAGRSIVVDLTIVPLRDHEGRVTQLLTSAVDITERKQLEAQVQLELERNRQFLRNASDGVHILDEGGRVVEASDSFCALLGTSRAEMLGRSPASWNVRVTPESVEATVARIIRESRLQFETRYQHRDGRVIDVEVYAKAFEVGGRHYIYCAARDLTEIKALQREIVGAAGREQRRLGQELHDGLGQELTGAALIATALANRIEGQREVTAADLNDLKSIINRCIASANQIVRGLSPLSDVAGDLARALAELATSASRADTVVAFRADLHVPVALPVEVRGHLFRIAQEAVQNALKHARAQRIDVELTSTTAEVRIVVGDNGVGIGAQPTSRTGYGMHTMRYRAAAIGGQFAIEARSGGGTRVICSVSQPAAVEVRASA